MTFAVGMGRVTSLVTTATFSPGFTMSFNRGAPMGSLRARRTSASPVRPRGTSLAWSSPMRFRSGTSTSWMPVPNPKVSFIMLSFWR